MTLTEFFPYFRILDDALHNLHELKYLLSHALVMFNISVKVSFPQPIRVGRKALSYLLEFVAHLIIVKYVYFSSHYHKTNPLKCVE